MEGTEVPVTTVRVAALDMCRTAGLTVTMSETVVAADAAKEEATPTARWWILGVRQVPGHLSPSYRGHGVNDEPGLHSTHRCRGNGPEGASAARRLVGPRRPCL